MKELMSQWMGGWVDETIDQWIVGWCYGDMDRLVNGLVTVFWPVSVVKK